MKFLHVITDLNVGGAEIMLYRYLRALGGNAGDVQVLSLMKPGQLSQDIRDLGIPVQTLQMAQGKPTLVAIPRLRRIFAAFKPDIVHGWMLHGNIAASVGRWLTFSSKPVIWSVHHSLTDIEVEKPLTRKLIRLSARLSSKASGISFCSSVAQQQYQSIGFAPSASRIIPNGVDTEEFLPHPGAAERIRETLTIPPDRAIIGNVSRAHPMKDHAMLLHAARQLIDAGRKIHVVIIGDGHSAGPTETIARGLGIFDHVTLTGVRHDVHDLVPGFDLYALSSAWGEAFPLAVTEAMSCAVPAVVTDVGDCAWLVGETGTVVTPGDAPRFAQAVGDILGLAPREKAALGQRARRRVVEKFSITQYVQKHQELYQRVQI